MRNILPIILACFILIFSHCGGRSTRTSGLVELGSIYGFVTTEKYEPINLAHVLIAGDSESVTYTNQAGYFMVSDLLPGKYDLLITKAGFDAQNISVKVSRGKTAEINVTMSRIEKGKGMISGMVVDYLTNAPLVVDITITDLGLTTSTDSAGYFGFEGLEPKVYLLKVHALDYLTSHTDVNVMPDETAEMMVRMLKAGTVITLEGIEFEFGKAVIKPESNAVLDDAAAILTHHPEIEVEIQGHTDSIGTDEANLKLSQKRAEAVRDYLIDVHMIEPVRLIPRGFGETKPIADNGTEAGREKNRRVDFLILEK